MDIKKYVKLNENGEIEFDEKGFNSEYDASISKAVDKYANGKGRDEIRRAVCSIAEKVKAGELLPEDITEDVIGNHLYTGVLNENVPDPELMIRTSGEIRLSNYLLWQTAYSEFVFTDVLWPDFTPEEYEKCIEEYQNRDRRFGGR